MEYTSVFAKMATVGGHHPQTPNRRICDGCTPPEISIVLPAHNEAGNIAPCAALKASRWRRSGSYEIVFVDDGSTDGTLAALRAAAARDPAIR